MDKQNIPLEHLDGEALRAAIEVLRNPDIQQELSGMGESMERFVDHIRPALQAPDPEAALRQLLASTPIQNPQEAPRHIADLESWLNTLHVQDEEDLKTKISKLDAQLEANQARYAAFREELQKNSPEVIGVLDYATTHTEQVAAQLRTLMAEVVALPGRVDLTDTSILENSLSKLSKMVDGLKTLQDSGATTNWLETVASVVDKRAESVDDPKAKLVLATYSLLARDASDLDAGRTPQWIGALPTLPIRCSAVVGGGAGAGRPLYDGGAGRGHG